jgi:hypothetical protein
MTSAESGVTPAAALAGVATERTPEAASTVRRRMRFFYNFCYLLKIGCKSPHFQLHLASDRLVENPARIRPMRGNGLRSVENPT